MSFECSTMKKIVDDQLEKIKDRIEKVNELKDKQIKLENEIKTISSNQDKIIKEGNEYIVALKKSLNIANKELKQLQREFKKTKKLNPLGSLALNTNYYENNDIKNRIDRSPIKNNFTLKAIKFLNNNSLFNYFKDFFGPEIDKVWASINPNYKNTQLFKDYAKFAHYLSKVQEQATNMKALGLTTNVNLYNRVMYRSIGNNKINNISYKDGNLILFDKEGNEIENKFDEYLYLLSEEYTDSTNTTHRVLNPIVIKTIEALLPEIYHILNGYKYISIDKAAKIAGFKDKEDFEKKATYEEKQEVYQLLEEMRNKGLPQYELANEIGSMIIQELGIRFNENTPATFNENLKNSLGLYVLNSFTTISSATTNNESIFKIVKNNTQFNNKEMNLFKIEFKDEKHDDLFSKGLKGYTMFSSYITKRNSHQTDPIDPNKDVATDPKVKKTVATDIAPEAATFMKNASNENIYIANNAFDAFMSLDPEIREEIAGATDTSNVHYSNINNVNSNNDDVKRRIEFMEMFEGIIKSGFKTSWYQAINMRTHMDSSVNMQDNKIQRHLLKIKDTMDSIINLEKDLNGNKMYMFKIALAQAFDLEPDKNTDKDVFIKLNNLFTITKSGLRIKQKNNPQGALLKKALDATILLINGKKLSVKQQQDIANFIKGKENVHAFHALTELTRLHLSLKNKDTEFITDLALESDAITSGMIISLQNMLFSGMFDKDIATKNQIESLLAKGGFYILRNKLGENNIDDLQSILGLEPSEALTKEDKKQYLKELEEFKTDLRKGELTHGKLLTSKFFKDFYNSLSTYVNNVVKNEDYMNKMFYEIGATDEKGNTKKVNINGEELTPYTINKKLHSIGIWLLNQFKNKEGKIEFTRKIVKPAMMVKNYGASMKAIMRKLYGTIVLDKMYEKMAYFGSKGLKLGNLYESILNKDSMPNLDEKDLIEYKKLVTQIKGIILSNYNDRFKTEIKDIKDIKKFTPQMIHNFFTAYEHNELTGRIIQHSLFADTSLDKPIDLSVLDLTLEKIDIRPNLIKAYYNKVFEPILGTIFKKAFNDNLGMLDKFQEKLQNISRLTFNTTYPILIKKLNETYGKKDLNKYTQKEYEEVIKEMIEEGIWYDFNSAFVKSKISSEKTEKSKTNNVIRIGVNNKTLTTTIQEIAKVFAENLPAIGPIMAHQTDSTYMIQTLNSDEAYKRIVHVFDALLFGLNPENLDSIRDYNKSVFDNSIKYNIYLALLHKVEMLIKNPETRQYLGKSYSEFVNDNLDKKEDQLALMNSNYNGLGTILAELLDENLLNTAMSYIKDTLDNSKISILHNYVIDKKETIYTPDPEDIKNIMKEMFITLDPEEDFLNIDKDLIKEIFDNAYNPINDEKINIANAINTFFFAKEFLETKNNKEYTLNEMLAIINKMDFKNKDILLSTLNNIIINIKSDKDKDLKKTMNESKFYKYSKFRKLVKNENPAEPNGGKDIEEQIEPGDVSIDTINSNNYADRTKINANADVTIAIATDFNTAGEKVTKKFVNQNGKLYLPISIQDRNVKLIRSDIDNLINKIKALNKSSIELNIAGNGIYSFNQTNQEILNKYLTKLIKELLNNGIKIHLIRSGGQTGIDEAGIIAAINNNIPAKVLGTNNYAFRVKKEEFNKLKEKYNLQPNEYKKVYNNYDIFHKQAFEDRFKKQPEPKNEDNQQEQNNNQQTQQEELKTIPLSNKNQKIAITKIDDNTKELKKQIQKLFRYFRNNNKYYVKWKNGAHQAMSINLDPRIDKYEYTGATHPRHYYEDFDGYADFLEPLAREVEKKLGKKEGYYNHVLINEFGKGYGIKKHPDNEELYQYEENKLRTSGSVAIISIGNTQDKHTFGSTYSKNDLEAYAEDGSLIEMSTGDIYHYVGKAGDGGRISITFRHVPESNMKYEDKQDSSKNENIDKMNAINAIKNYINEFLLNNYSDKKPSIYEININSIDKVINNNKDYLINKANNFLSEKISFINENYFSESQFYKTHISNIEYGHPIIENSNGNNERAIHFAENYNDIYQSTNDYYDIVKNLLIENIDKLEFYKTKKNNTPKKEIIEEEDDIPFSSQVSHLGSKQSEQTFKNEQELEQFMDTLNEDFNPVQQSTMNKIKSALHTVFNKAKELKIEHFINNTFNRGSALVKRNIIKLSKGGGLSLQNEKEIFLHEMTHMVTHTAFTYDAKLKTRILQLQKTVLNHMSKNNVDPETFFIPIGMAHTDVAKQRSKEMFEYIKGDPEEFFTVATTNPILNRYINNNNINVKQEWLQEMDNQNIIDKFLNSIMNVFNKVLSSVGTKKANKELNDIFITAVAITNDIKNNNYKPTPITDKIHLTKLVNLTKNLPIVKQGVATFSHLSKVLIQSFLNGYEKGIKELSTKNNSIYKIHQQTLAAFNFSAVDLIRDLQAEMFKDRTKDTDFFTIFNEIKHQQETVRMQQEVANINLLNELIPKELQTPDKLNSLTNSILNTDLSALTNTEAITYVTNDINRKLEISNLENILLEDPQGQLMINQAKALAYYMNTGGATINNLQLNAHNIDNRYFILDPNERYISDVSYEKELDKLITLYSLEYLEPNDINNLKEFINTDVNNFKNLLTYIKSTIKQDTLTLFEEPTHIIKGYSKPKAKSIYETTMINAKDLSKYEMHGWQIYKTYNQDNTNIASEVKQVYLMRRVNTEPEYTKGAFEITRNSTFGSKISEIYLGDTNLEPNHFYEQILPKLKINLSIINSDVNFNPQEIAKKLSSKNQQKLIPLVDTEGNIIDYRYALDKTTNIVANELDMDIRKVIANTQSHMFLKINGKEINEKLIKFFQNKYNHLNDNELVTIGHVNGELKGEEYYSILPENTKKYLAWNGEYFKVPKYLINNVIGYKNSTIYNSILFTKYDKHIGKFVDRFKSKNINKLRRKLQLFEKYWKDFIKTVKPLMVIANGPVLLGNLMSNFWVLSQFMPIEQVFKEMRKNWIEYDKLHKEYIKLRALEPKVKIGIATKQEKLEFNYLKKSIKRNRLNTLHESGAIGSIIEDTTISDINNSNILEYKFEQYVGNKLPSQTKNLLKTIFIAEESSPFKKAMKIMQYGDVVAKQTLMDYYIKQGISSKEALIKADQYFINYNLNQNKIIKYLNDVGALMFSKFLFGSIKVMIQTLKEKPEGLLKLGAINELVDVPEIYETYNKSLIDIITNRQIHFYQEAENLVNPYSRIERMFSL